MAKTTNDIKISVSNKVKYTINGDAGTYIMLNPSDMGIIARLGEIIPIINGLVDRYEDLIEKQANDDFIEFSKSFKDIDTQLRDVTNRLFDYDVCSVICGGGSMLDAPDGDFMYAVIITTLMQMYQDTISVEMKKAVEKMKKHTSKYTPKDHQTKKR